MECNDIISIFVGRFRGVWIHLPTDIGTTFRSPHRRAWEVSALGPASRSADKTSDPFRDLTIYFPNTPRQTQIRALSHVVCLFVYLEARQTVSIIMAIDLTYPLAMLILAGVAATNMASLPYATGLVVMLLAINSFRTSKLSTLEKH